MSIAAVRAPRQKRRINPEDTYRPWLDLMRHAVPPAAPVFTTDADPESLWDAYLNNLPRGQRQHHTCHACRHFITRFGGLAQIDTEGNLFSAVWDESSTPELYQSGIREMIRLVRRARVTGIFLSERPILGTPITGEWQHFAVQTPRPCQWKRGLLTAGQKMAERREDYRTVQAAMAGFSLATLGQVVTLLKSEALYRSEKVLGPAQWLYDLKAAQEQAKGKRRENLTWAAIATAPPGFCHPKSSMIGTLLEDLESGHSFSEVARRFKDKMRPDLYQRPQAPPSAGNIAQAEKVVEQLGIAPSLQRRYARLEEIETLWTPTNPRKAQPGNGVFADLIPKGQPAPLSPGEVPSVPITWEKFARAVLPEALRIEYLIPGRGSFGAIATAVNAEAPPILQWDHEDQRNPFSWYQYINGSDAARWNLPARAWHPVEAVTLLPCFWHGMAEQTSHFAKGLMLILGGARDMRGGDLALFPEILRADLRAARATIEAFSKQGKMAGAEEASACGLILMTGDVRHKWDARLRVHTAQGIAGYTLERWD